METSAQGTLELLIGMVAVVLVVQTILIVAILAVMWKASRNTKSGVEKLARKVETLIEGSNSLLAEGREKLAVVGSNLVDISQLVKTQAHRLDELVKDTTDRAQMQVVRLDHLIGDTMNRVEETTAAIQRGVLRPVQEVSAVVAGVQAALDFLFNHRRRTVERATQDEELFI